MLYRFLALLCLSLPTFVLAAGSLSGRLVDPSGEGIPHIEVLLSEGSQQTTTDVDGRFEFRNLPAGFYTLQVNTSEYQTPPQQTIRVNDEKNATMKLSLEPRLQTEVTLTVTGQSRSTAEVSQVVDVLQKDDLDTMRQTSLGDTLASRPGISSTSYATAGRPIIRGLSGDRIRILEGGLGTGDVSTVSVDHVITVDMAGLEQVEILRGPAALRYGGAALGGVVNMLDDRFPNPSNTGKVAGSLELNGDTVADRRGGRLRLEGGNERWAWQVNTTAARTEDYSIPGPAERFPESDEETQDVLADSAMDLRKYGVGLSYNLDRGSFGMAYTDYRNDYGIPGHEHHHHHKREEADHHDEHEDEAEHGAFIDLEQKRFDMKGNLFVDRGVIQNLQLNLAGTDYAHVEAEEGNPGTLFSNDYVEGRLEATTGSWGFFDRGGLGVHITHRDFSAVGQEVFVLPNTTKSLGAFFTQEVTGDNWNVTVGARYDRRQSDGSIIEHEHDHDDHHDESDHLEDDHDDHHDEDDHHEEDGEEEFFQRTFNVFSGAVGLVLGTHSTYNMAVNLTHTERAPTAEALFASGPHIATSSFEVGNPEMSEEVSQGLDVKLRKQKGRITGEVSLFYMDFEDYIYERFTGEEEDGLREIVFTQADSETYGGESRIEVALISESSHQLDLRLTYDQVRSSLDDGTPLPRITPQRYGASLISQFRQFRVSGDFQHVRGQERVAPFETVSEDYTLANLGASWRFMWAGLNHQLLFRARNITDEEARIHTSFLKDRILQPGRNFSMSYRLLF